MKSVGLLRSLTRIRFITLGFDFIIFLLLIVFGLDMYVFDIMDMTLSMWVFAFIMFLVAFSLYEKWKSRKDIFDIRSLLDLLFNQYLDEKIVHNHLMSCAADFVIPDEEKRRLATRDDVVGEKNIHLERVSNETAEKYEHFMKFVRAYRSIGFDVSDDPYSYMVDTPQGRP